jgi:hypothetical protein
LAIYKRLLPKRPAAVTAVTKERRPVDIVRFDFFRGARWHPDVHHNRRRHPCPPVSLDGMTISAKTFRSWDGVLCARVFPRKPPQPGAGAEYMLWNPLTNACAVVSAPTGQGHIIGGYAHPITGRFHLLHSDVAAHRHHDLVAPIAARILAVGDGTDWRGVPLPCSLSMMGERDHSVNLHGNLHWLVQPAGSEKAAQLVFDTAQEKFRPMAAPERPGLDPKTARSRYSDTRSWRLRETVRLAAACHPSAAEVRLAELVLRRDRRRGGSGGPRASTRARRYSSSMNMGSSRTASGPRSGAT